jgi:two-component system chemotaxis response regulator CheY
MEMLAALRAEGRQMPVGFVSAQGTAQMHERAKSAGAAFLVTKPFTSEDVRAALVSMGV